MKIPFRVGMIRKGIFYSDMYFISESDIRSTSSDLARLTMNCPFLKDEYFSRVS